MDRAKVFISSILDPKKEDLRRERNVAKEVVESYEFLEPWAFEDEPASPDQVDEEYLRNVETCDLFIQIVGSKSTEPVATESLRAIAGNKPILLFAKTVDDRSAQAEILLKTPGVKYVAFDSLDDLRRTVRESISHTLVLGLRSLRQGAGGGPTTAQLRQLVQNKAIVCVKPAIPAKAEIDKFQVQEVTSDALVVEKLSSGHRIQIPIGRVAEVLVLAPGEPPVVQLDGRLQWLTISDSWKFFDLKPDPASPYGFHKPSHLQDVCAFDIGEALKKRGGRMGWRLERDLPGSLVRGVEIVYDDDGKYFRTPSRPSDLIYVWIRN